MVRFCDSPNTIRARSEIQTKFDKMAKQLAKDNIEKCKRLVAGKDGTNGDNQDESNHNKFLAQLQKFETLNRSPTSSVGKGKEKLTKSFTFGASDDDDDFVELLNNDNAVTPSRVKQDNSFRKYKSTSNFDSKTSTDPFGSDDDELILASQIIENKVTDTVKKQEEQEKPQVSPIVIDELDSFDEILTSIPLDIDKLPVPDKKPEKNSFVRHQTMPTSYNASNLKVSISQNRAFGSNQPTRSSTTRSTQNTVRPPAMGFRPKEPSLSSKRPVQPQPSQQKRPTLNTSTNTISISNGKISNSNYSSSSINNNNNIQKEQVTSSRTCTAAEIEAKRQMALEMLRKKRSGLTSQSK